MLQWSWGSHEGSWKFSIPHEGSCKFSIPHEGSWKFSILCDDALLRSGFASDPCGGCTRLSNAAVSRPWDTHAAGSIVLGCRSLRSVKQRSTGRGSYRVLDRSYTQLDRAGCARFVARHRPPRGGGLGFSLVIRSVPSDAVLYATASESC